MARTKASITIRSQRPSKAVKGGKSTKGEVARGVVKKYKKGKSLNLIPMTPRKTPTWQKQISEFFKNILSDVKGNKPLDNKKNGVEGGSNILDEVEEYESDKEDKENIPPKMLMQKNEFLEE